MGENSIWYGMAPNFSFPPVMLRLLKGCIVAEDDPINNADSSLAISANKDSIGSSAKNKAHCEDENKNINTKSLQRVNAQIFPNSKLPCPTKQATQLAGVTNFFDKDRSSRTEYLGVSELPSPDFD